DHMHWYWTKDQSADGFANTIDKLRFSKTGRQVYFHPDGRLRGVGEILRNPDLANTLERIAKSGGSDIFYHGELAEQIAADFAANGGLISVEDLKQYKLDRAKPIWGEYRGYRVASSPPPGSGFLLIELLQILENFGLGTTEHSSAEHVRLLFEAMKRMTIDKDQHQGDPHYVDVPLETLLSKEIGRASCRET